MFHGLEVCGLDEESLDFGLEDGVDRGLAGDFIGVNQENQGEVEVLLESLVEA